MAGHLDGVRTKILAQADAWARLDGQVEVGLFIRCEADAEVDWRGEPHVVQVRSSRAGMVGRLVARERLSLDVWRWRPDVMYLRQSTVSPSLIALASRLPTAIELNTLDLTELRLRSRVRHRYASLTRRALLQRARRLVAVSDDIAAHPSVKGLRIDVDVIPNGIDLDAYPALPATTNASPVLAFLGSPRTAWHGVDKVVEIARMFPDWRVEIIGPSASDVGPAPANVVVHGLLPPSEYRPILARADVSVGSLALHRVGLRSASPLKVGEYLAYGLATIIGYRDTRFPDDAPFLLRLPSREDNVALARDRIREFVVEWVGRRVPRADVSPIDTRTIERRRLAVLRSLVGPAVSRDPRSAR